MKVIVALFTLFCLSTNLVVDTKYKLPKVEIITEFNNKDIVYRGIANPIVIKVEKGITYEAVGNGLNKTDIIGNYTLYPTSGKKVVIKVIGKQSNGNVFEISKAFKIKNIGSGISQFNGKSCKKCSVKLSKKELSTGRVSFDFPNLLIDGLSIKVVSFKIKLPGKSTKKVYSNQITSKLLINDIQKVKIGSQIQLFDIQIKSFFPKNSGVRICKIQPIIIKITS